MEERSDQILTPNLPLIDSTSSSHLPLQTRLTRINSSRRRARCLSQLSQCVLVGPHLGLDARLHRRLQVRDWTNVLSPIVRMNGPSWVLRE